MALLAIGIVALGYLLYLSKEPGPGIVINLGFYEQRNGKLAEVSKNIIAKQSFITVAMVKAIAPPSCPNKTMVLYNGPTIDGRIYIPYQRIKPIAEEWVREYRQRGTDPKGLETGFFIYIAVLDKKTMKPVYLVIDSLSYKPSEVRRDTRITYQLQLIKSVSRIAKVDTHTEKVSLIKLLLTGSQSQRSSGDYITGTQPNFSPSPVPPYYFKTELVAIVTPENLTQKLPPSYFIWASGKLYMKTPIMIARNVEKYSGTVGVAVDITRTNAKISIYPTIAIDKNIVSRIKNNILPIITPWKGSSKSWGGRGYSFCDQLFLGPERSGWIWIWAYPVYEVEKVYICTFGDGCSYTGDSVKAYIADVVTKGKEIEGGASKEDFPTEIVNLMFKGVKLQRLRIDETGLADGDLDPEESVSHRLIFKYFDKCSSDFEIGVPIGSIAAAAACTVFDVPPPACTTATVFMSAFQITLSAESQNIMIVGGIKNYGDDPEIPNDYNKAEEVYIAKSIFRYKEDPPWWQFWRSTCYYDVPAGVYFEFK